MLVSQDENLCRLAQDIETKTTLCRRLIPMSVILIGMQFFGIISDGCSLEIAIIGSCMVDRYLFLS